MSHAHATLLPKGALIMAGALVLGALTVTTAARLTGMPPAASPERMRAAANVMPVTSSTLRFADRDRTVVITDAASGRIVHVVAAGEETGFIRGVMRGLARDRRMRGIGAAAPFRLTLWRDGELTLDDTATGRSIELSAFGASNRAAFAALLEPQT